MKPTLPISINYQDKLDLAKRVISIYSALQETDEQKLTGREQDIMQLAMIYDIGEKDFGKKAIDYLGFKNMNGVRTVMTRIKAKNLVQTEYRDGRTVKVLSQNMKLLKKLIDAGPDVDIKISFVK